MGLEDKITGRAKKAVADLTDDPELHREGRREERKGELREARREADLRAEEVASLGRRTR